MEDPSFEIRTVSAKQGINRHAYLILYHKSSSQLIQLLQVLDDNRNDIYRGSQWFSITHQFAVYILQHRKWIRKQFRWTTCLDEVFIQSILMKSPFRSSLLPNMRLIDWRRRPIKANSYISRNEDFEMIKNSDCLFARKFDAEIIGLVFNELCCPHGAQ